MTRLPRSKSKFRNATAAAAFVFGLFFLLVGTATIAGATGLNQGIIVPELARRDLPVVLDGSVFTHAQVGNRIFVGGDFDQVELIDGTVIDQANIFAYDINTGIVDPNFRPVLNNVVRTLETTQDGLGLYVGGAFTRWDNSFPLRLAKLDRFGNLDTSFLPQVSARVQGLIELGDSVYIGGDFTSVSGVNAVGLAKLDRVTGAVDASFTPAVTQSDAGNSLVRSIEALPDDSGFFVLHYGRRIDGQVRDAVAKFDIDAAGNPSLSGWNIDWFGQAGRRDCLRDLRDLEISPDGSFLVIGGQGADNPPNCDSVLRYPTGGNATVAFDWAARLYSSVFSLAVSDVAVYVGGHFCAAPLNPIAPGGISSDFTGTANGCNVNDPLDPINPSQRDPENAVFRQQLAALDPGNGQALPWQPGTNAGLGVLDLTLIDRGLLAGQDVDRFSTFLVGRSGFFDLFPPGPDEIAPEFSLLTPVDGEVRLSVTELTGIAVDDRVITSVSVQLRNVGTNEWIRSDGTFAPGVVNVTPITTVSGLGSVEWNLPVPSLAAGTYQVRGFATDNFGNTAPTSISTFTVAGAATCTAAIDANGQAVITLNNFDGGANNSVVIRRDNLFVESQPTPITTYVDTAATPGDHSYEVRWFPEGVLTDVPCTPATVTVPPPAGPPPVALVCTVALDANGDPVLTWNQVPNVSNYVVRESGSFITTVVNGSTYTEVGAPAGDYTYEIRIRPGGVLTDITCDPSPITVVDNTPPPPPPVALVCTAALDANGDPVLTWNQVPNVSNYVVRESGSFITTVVNGSTYTEVGAPAGDYTYEIRIRPGGVLTDITCDPSPITVVDNTPPPPPPAALVCTVALDANGDPVLTWNQVPNVSNYVVREGGSFITTVVNGSTYTEVGAPAGDYNYELRVRPGGVLTDITCTPSPLVVN